MRFKEAEKTRQKSASFALFQQVLTEFNRTQSRPSFYIPTCTNEAQPLYEL